MIQARTYAENKKIYWENYKDLNDELDAVKKQTIRKRFDSTQLEAVMRACIAIAQQEKFTDLAAEMETDLETEIG